MFLLRAFVAFVIFSKDTVNEFLDKNCPHVAAAISFYALLSLFPLVLALITVLSFALGSPESKAQLAEEIGGLVPVSDELVTTTVEQVVRARNVTGIAAVIGLLWVASAVFGAIRKGINTAWGIRQTRPFFQERLIDFSLALGAGLLFLVSISSTAVLTFFQEIFTLLYPEASVNGDFIWDQAAAIIPPTLTLLSFLVLYWFLPNTRVHLRYVWPGAVAATVAFEVVKNGFVLYVGRYSTYNIVYGSLSAVVALMFWLYLSAIILLFCALLISKYSAYMEEQKRTRHLTRLLAETSQTPAPSLSGETIR